MRLLSVLILWGCQPPASSSDRIIPGDPEVFPDPFHSRVLDGEPREMAIEVGAVGASALRLNPREWVDGQFSFEGETYPVEVRLKGHGSFEPFDQRPSLKVRFEHTFFGHKTVILNNNHSDSTASRERLAASAFALAGVPAARAGSVWVELNGANRGLYTVLEDVDRTSLRRWFSHGRGPLFEVFDGDFTTELVGGIEHEGGPENYALVEGTVDALALGDVVGFDEASQFIDRDAFLRFFAVTAFVAQTDAYPYSDPGDDVYLYAAPDTGRLHFLPHGLDEAFQPRDMPLNRVNGLLARRCLANASCREGLAEQLAEVSDVLAGPWDLERQRVLRSAEAWVEDDRWLTSSWGGTIIDLEFWREERRDVLEEELGEFADL